MKRKEISDTAMFQADRHPDFDKVEQESQVDKTNRNS